MEKTVSVEDHLKVYELCKTQLGGKWAEVKANELIIRPNNDGFVNKLFYCNLPENIETEYNKVVIRYTDYESLKEYFEATHVLAISLIASEKKLSPKLLSVFGSGTIIECIDCRYLNASDDINNRTVKLLAQKLAAFHSIKAPIPKDMTLNNLNPTEWVIDKWLDTDKRHSYTEGVVRQQIVEHKFETLSKLNFIDELEWFRKTLIELKSPIVLSHNDFKRRNILVRESKNSSDVELFLIDFDWSDYNYRGIDLGQYFCTWGQIETDFGSGDFPTDQQMSVFIDAYISEMSKIFGDSYTKHAINSRESLIKESKVCALLGYIKDLIYWITVINNGDSEFLPKGEIIFKCYDNLKQRILKEYSVAD